MWQKLQLDATVESPASSGLIFVVYESLQYSGRNVNILNFDLLQFLARNGPVTPLIFNIKAWELTHCILCGN